jgi:hypothetical protein
MNETALQNLVALMSNIVSDCSVKQDGETAARFCIELAELGARTGLCSYGDDVNTIKVNWPVDDNLSPELSALMIKYIEERDRLSVEEVECSKFYWMALLLAGSMTKQSDLSEGTLDLMAEASMTIGIDTEDTLTALKRSLEMRKS